MTAYKLSEEAKADLIRIYQWEVQQYGLVRAKLIAAETSGFTQKTVAEIKREALQGLGIHDSL
jgi:hypothetical protein